MPTKIHIGYSKSTDPQKAGEEAVKQALAPLADRKPDILLLFSTNNLDPFAVLAAVRGVAQNVPLVGGCSNGVIVDDQTFNQGVAVMAISSDTMQVITGGVSSIGQNPEEKARTLIRDMQAQVKQEGTTGLCVCFVDPDLHANTAAIKALGEALPPNGQLVGGGTRGPADKVESSTFLNDDVLPNGIAAAMLVTPGAVGVGVRHGYRPHAQQPLTVTRVAGNIVYELNGKSSFDVYSEHLPVKKLSPETFTKFALDYPLGIPQPGSEYTIRDPYAILPDGAIMVGAPIPDNATVQIMFGNRATMIDAAQQAAQDARQNLKGQAPIMAVVFSCVTRLAYLGVGVRAELVGIRTGLRAKTPTIGLFSFGELAINSRHPAIVHNKTVVIGLLN
jgi:hypothetical protein